MNMTRFALVAGLVLTACLASAQGLPVPAPRPARAPGSPAAHGRGPSRARGGRAPQRTRENLSREDQRLLERLENSPDFRELQRLFPMASASRSVDVRQALVSELESQGEHGVNMLAALIGDRDADVADAAYMAWSSAVQDMKPRRRAEAIVEAASMLSGRMQAPAGVAPHPPVPVPVQVR